MAESRPHAIRKLGDTLAIALHARLADLAAAKDPTELPLGYRPLPDRPKRFAISLARGGEVVFESNHLRDREAPAHLPVNWHGVSRIKMIEVLKSDD